MKRFFTLLSVGLLLAACTDTRRWIAEDESGAATVVVRGDTTEITAPAGLTLWYPEPLAGDYRIAFTAEAAPAADRADSLAGFDCFWAASDPAHPRDLFARSDWRGGIAERYGTLDLFCVGFGESGGTATRFRRFYGNLHTLPENMSRPVQQQYADSAYLLRPGRPLRIEISVSEGKTVFAIDGKRLFLRALGKGEGDGYFGLRFFSNRVTVSGLKIESL